MRKFPSSRFRTPGHTEESKPVRGENGRKTIPIDMETPPRYRILLDCTEAAAYLKLEVSTLADWRYHKKGPRWIPLSRRRVLYDLDDLNRYLDEQMLS